MSSRIQGAQPLRHPAPDVTAEGAEALVAKGPGHERVPDLGDAPTGEPLLRQFGVEEAGQRKDDHVEGIGGVTAVARRVGQPPGDAQHLHEAARPAVGEDQRQRLGCALDALGAYVHELHLPAGDLREVVRVGGVGRRREPGAGEQVLQDIVGYGDTERIDGGRS